MRHKNIKRGTGRTTEQIKNAPIGAIYVWVNDIFGYPKEIAEKLGRTDLEFVSPSRLLNGQLRGREPKPVVVDHAVYLNREHFDECLLMNERYQLLRDQRNRRLR